MRLIASLLFNVLFILHTAFILVFFLPTLLGGWQGVFFAQKWWARGVSFFARVLLGITYEVRGAEHIPEDSSLIACKHQSAWETCVPFLFLDGPCLVLKKELTNLPFFGWYARVNQSIPVDRNANAAALRNMIKAGRQAVSENRPILIFPEGTRKAVGAEPDYQPGVAGLYKQLNLTATPVALNSGCFWPRRSIIKNSGTIVIEFLPPIEAGLDRREFMARLEEAIESKTAELVEEARSR